MRTSALLSCAIGIFLFMGSVNAAFSAEKGDILVAIPPLNPAFYPCMKCHQGIPVNRTKRQLGMHTEIVLEHDAKHRWCLDCHDATNRNKLHLASGEQIEFPQFVRLCEQCHGKIVREWEEGIHGKRIGNWNGQKRVLQCLHCHNPHSPKVKPIAAFPAPIAPESKPFFKGKK